MKKITLRFLSDPGHGWLSVTHELIRKLGVADKISGHSYMTNTRAYLEEDSDAGIVLDALKTAGYEIKVTESHTNKLSNVRYLSSYNAEFVKQPLYYGEEVIVRGTNVHFVYKGFLNKNRALIESAYCKYSIPIRTMFSYIEGRVQKCTQ